MAAMKSSKGQLRVRDDRALKRGAGDDLSCVFITGYRYDSSSSYSLLIMIMTILLQR